MDEKLKQGSGDPILLIDALAKPRPGTIGPYRTRRRRPSLASHSVRAVLQPSDQISFTLLRTIRMTSEAQIDRSVTSGTNDYGMLGLLARPIMSDYLVAGPGLQSSSAASGRIRGDRVP